MDGIRIPLPHLRRLHVCHDEEAGSGYEIIIKAAVSGGLNYLYDGCAMSW